MRVLLSIKPKFALKIFEGSKKYEYRRVLFRSEEVTAVLVYASLPIARIIGEFEIAEILHEEPKQLWVKTRKHAGITKQDFDDYFADIRKGYAIEVKGCTMYEVPLSLENFMISSPPQSFMYIE